MVRSIISYAVIGLLGLASSASAVFYADYELDPSYGLAFAGPLSTVTSIVGNTLIQNKAACNLYDDCIAILQSESIF